jgi:hypothetical protein
MKEKERKGMLYNLTGEADHDPSPTVWISSFDYVPPLLQRQKKKRYKTLRDGRERGDLTKIMLDYSLLFSLGLLDLPRIRIQVERQKLRRND